MKLQYWSGGYKETVEVDEKKFLSDLQGMISRQPEMPLNTLITQALEQAAAEEIELGWSIKA